MNRPLQNQPDETKILIRYRQEELERMTLLQLRDICERQKILHGGLYQLDKDRLIRLILRFRGSYGPLLIQQPADGGGERIEQALRGVKLHLLPDALEIPAKIVVWEGLDTGYFDGYTLPMRQEIEGVNAVVLDREGGVCAIFNIIAAQEREKLYLARNGQLPCRQAEARDYMLLVFPRQISDRIFALYGGQDISLPPEIEVYGVRLLDFVVRKPVQAPMPLCIDFGTTNTAAGIHADPLFCEQFGPELGQVGLTQNKIHYVQWLDEEGSKAPVLPTIIGIDRIEDGKPVWLIGREAEKLVMDGFFGEGVSVWYDIKRWLGDCEQSEELSDHRGNRIMATRREIIRAFLTYVIKSAEQRFKCHFQKLYLSCPVKQKARFLAFYREIFPEYDLLEQDMVDEGVAVLYNTIHSYIENNYYENGIWYKALIVDCGGGTTDLTSADFSITNSRISYKISIKTSYENGDTDFGGNNLTFRILQMLKIEAARRLTGEGQSLYEITAGMEQECYRTVDEQGSAPLYQALNQAYEQAEQVIPTRWQEYENASRDEYHLVRGNYYYLFTLAERIKKAFFSDSRLQAVTICSNQAAASENTESLWLAASRWKLSAFMNGKLELQKEFPTVHLGAPTVRVVLNPDIYDLIRRFFGNLKLEEYSAINLTGQSCRIPLFRDALKEFIPGRYIRTGGKAQEDYRLKLSCLDGAIRYITDHQLGLSSVTIKTGDMSLPWELFAYTHTNQKAVLIPRLSRNSGIGTVSRPMQSSRLQLYLEDVHGAVKHIFSVACPQEQFQSVTYEELAGIYGDIIPQAEIDIIENGEIRYFVWADAAQWGFHVLPAARREETLLLGHPQLFPFENDSWTVNFFDGKK